MINPQLGGAHLQQLLIKRFGQRALSLHLINPGQLVLALESTRVVGTELGGAVA